jgi:hypothetical protein
MPPRPSARSPSDKFLPADSSEEPNRMVSVDTAAESWAEFALGEVPLPGNPSLWEPRDERVRDALFSLNTSLLQPLGTQRPLSSMAMPPRSPSGKFLPADSPLSEEPSRRTELKTAHRASRQGPLRSLVCFLLNSKLPTEHPAKDLCEASFAFF